MSKYCFVHLQLKASKQTNKKLYFKKATHETAKGKLKSLTLSDEEIIDNYQIMCLNEC